MTREELIRGIYGDGQVRTCCICGEEFIGYGNNPYPVVKDGESRCCDLCDSMVVIPARIRALYGVPEEIEEEVRSASAESVKAYRREVL